MAIFYNDTFTTAATTNQPLETHTSDSGHTYVVSLAGVPIVDYQNDRLYTTTGANARQYWKASATPPNADYKVHLDVTVLSTVDFTLCGPGARVQGATTKSGYFAIIDPNLDQLQIAKYVDGVETILGTPYTIGLGVLPETHKVTIEVSGSIIKAYLDDVERVSATDSTLTAAGGPGGIIRVNADYSHFYADNASAETLVAATSTGISTKTLERLGAGVSATSADVFVWSGHNVDMGTTAADLKVLGATITSGVLQAIDLSSTAIAVGGNITVVVIPASGGPGIAIETTAEDLA